MEDWKEFAETTQNMYGVDMSCLEKEFEREQKEYYVLSSRWAELGTGCILAEPCVVKTLDMAVCTVEDARGVGLGLGQDKGEGAPFDFDIDGRRHDDGSATGGATGPISGFAGWFTVDFKSRTDDIGRNMAPCLPNPAYLSTGPEMGCESHSFVYFFVSVCAPFSVGEHYNVVLVRFDHLELSHSFALCVTWDLLLHALQQTYAHVFNRYSLGTTSFPPPFCHSPPHRSNHPNQWHHGNDAHERKREAVQCSLPIYHFSSQDWS